MHEIAVENFSKALALITLAIPLITVEGKVAGDGDCPEFRSITNDDLEKNGFKTVEEAEEAGFEGTIIYGFASHPMRKRIATAFDKAFHSPKMRMDIPDIIDLSTAKGREKAMEFAATIIAFAFRNRKFFAERRKKVRAKLHLTKSKESFTVIDRRASPEEKERLSR
jgi:hypothetical protein